MTNLEQATWEGFNERNKQIQSDVFLFMQLEQSYTQPFFGTSTYDIGWQTNYALTNYKKLTEKLPCAQFWSK